MGDESVDKPSGGESSRLAGALRVRGYYLRVLPLIAGFWAVALYVGSEPVPYVAAAVSTIIWTGGFFSLSRLIQRERQT